jgi:hypothetical protein
MFPGLHPPPLSLSTHLERIMASGNTRRECAGEIIAEGKEKTYKHRSQSSLFGEHNKIPSQWILELFSAILSSFASVQMYVFDFAWL